MKYTHRCRLLGALLILPGLLRAADDFADQVVDYTPGTGINTAYETPSSALGAPASVATITAPAFLPTDIVGVGIGGQLTVAFNTPITNDGAHHASGMDFSIFGNEFFTLSGATIRSIFNHPGLTVWVSRDNVTYYQLAAPYGADEIFPTQGTGDPGLPVNPSISSADFTGQTVPGALGLYNGSAGGASFSIGWAVDANGNPVYLPSISYIRIEGATGYGYVDAIARVEDVPEPIGLGLISSGLAVLLPRRARGSRSPKNFRANTHPEDIRTLYELPSPI